LAGFGRHCLLARSGATILPAVPNSILAVVAPRRHARWHHCRCVSRFECTHGWQARVATARM